jgi:hypothetical protein
MNTPDGTYVSGHATHSHRHLRETYELRRVWFAAAVSYSEHTQSVPMGTFCQICMPQRIRLAFCRG